MFKLIRSRTKPVHRRILQQGSALIVALVFLLLMTLIGTATMQGTSQQEIMARNVLDRNLAFQAAEAALRQGGDLVMSQAFVMPPRESADPGNANVDNPNAYNWVNATVYSGVINGVSAQPRYAVRWIKAYGGGLSGIYRVTARGQGGTLDAVVVLQTTVIRDDS